MKTVQVHVKYAQEGDDNLNSSRNTPGAIDSQFYIGKRLPLPLLGSVNSHLAESGGLEQYIIRSPTLPNVRQSLDLHSVTEDDKAALAELEVTPRSPRERTQRTNSNEAPYEDLFLNVPKLGAMLNISKSKGKNYYENLQEASRKRIQALYYNKTSPRGPIDPNILQEGDERTTPREPVEPPAPQSKPIHFTSRPRPKSGNRTYRKPGPSEFVLSADNSFSLRDSPVNSTQYEAQGPTASHLPMQPNTQLIALPTQVLDSPMLSARDDVTAAHPSMFDTSLSATSQISFVKQMKAIPPPTFVSVCLPSVPVVPHSAQNSNASILTSTDLVKKQQVLPMVSDLLRNLFIPC
ncbi:hypothetical protein EON65_20600 [archaeon]|nr:MAG: hypothetical protein EON65_20600 [archaeon]